MDLYPFLVAITQDWIVLLSGGGSVLLLIIGLALGDKPVPRRFIFIIAGACFFFAAARVWTTEHRARLQAETQRDKLEEEQKTDFRVIVEQTTTVNADDKFVILLGASIINRGAPSSLHGLSLNITLANGRHLSIIPAEIPNGFKLYTNSGTIDYNQDDNLSIKIGRSLMQRGETRGGPALFVLPNGLKFDDLPGGKYTLSCRDYLDGTFSSDENAFANLGRFDGPFRVYH